MSPLPQSALAQRLRTARERLGALRTLASQAFAPSRAPVPFDGFTDDEVGGYDAVHASDDPQRIDDATWRDLEVKALLRRIAGTASIYARQYLCQRLRRGSPVQAGARPAWLGGVADEAQVLAQTAAVRRDLRCEDMEVTGLLFRDERVALPEALGRLRWAKLLWIAGIVLALAGWVGLAAVLGCAYLLAWGTVEARFHARLQACKRQRRAVLAMLKAVVDLGVVAGGRPHPVLADAAASAAMARRLLVALDFDALERGAASSDYVNLLTMHEYACAPARMARVTEHLEALRSLYAVLAECDGRLCLMAYLSGPRETCWARPSGLRDMNVVQMRNPLLDGAQPLSIELRGEGIFLTGENGVGKSTLLRAVGLNLLTARAFGFCHAAEAAVPMRVVCSSIVHEESIEIGDSLYMAEMRRAQSLLRAAQRPEGAVFLVDEIFRGTNHVESVAGAAAVLNRLAAGGALIVASHNVVLGLLLRAGLASWRIVRADAQRLALERGVLREPNGISMMQRFGVADDVLAQARRVHAWFSGHVATPATFPALD